MDLKQVHILDSLLCALEHLLPSYLFAPNDILLSKKLKKIECNGLESIESNKIHKIWQCYKIDKTFFIENIPADIPLSFLEVHLHPMDLLELLYFESRLGFQHLHPLICFWLKVFGIQTINKKDKKWERKRKNEKKLD